MSYFLDRLSGVRCVNCSKVFQLWHVRDVLVNCTFFSHRQKFFWEPNQFYDPPKEQQVKCKDCQMEQSPRKHSVLLAEVGFWLGGVLLTAVILYALFSLIGPAPRPHYSLSVEGLAAAQRDGYSGQQDGGVVLFILFMMPVPPICFWIARRLSYRLIRFHPLPSKQRPSHVGLG